MGHKCEYLDGIAFPIKLDSNIVVNILNDHCFTFSTKERVPFKLVAETISHDDAYKIKNGKPPVYKSEVEQYQEESEPYVFPNSYFGSLWQKAKK